MVARTLAGAGLAVAVGCGTLYAGPVFRAAVVADLGWSHELAAGAFAVGYLAAGATPILSGIVADRFGPSRLLSAGLLLAAAGLLAAAQTTQPWHWYLAAGVGLSVAYFLVHVAATLTATAGAARGTAVGVALGLGVGLGLAAGSPLAQAAVDALGWRAALTWLGLAVLLVALGLTWALVGRHTRSPTPAGPGAAGTGGPGPDGEGGLGDWAAPGGSRAETGQDELPSRARRRLLAGFFLGNVLLAVFDEAVYQHGYSLALARGASPREAAGLLSVASLGLTAGMLVGGPLSDLAGRRRVLVGAALLVAASLLGLTGAAAGALWWWGAVYGVGLGASIAVRSAAWGDAFRGAGRGRAVGIVASGYPVGAAATIWLGAAWLDAGGGFTAIGLAAALAAVLWALLGGALTGGATRAASSQPSHEGRAIGVGSTAFSPPSHEARGVRVGGGTPARSASDGACSNPAPDGTQPPARPAPTAADLADLAGRAVCPVAALSAGGRPAP